jgi:hypothetical protein
MPIVYNILQIRYDCMTVTMPFDPLPLIGVNLWQRATRAFDPLSDAEDTGGLPLIQQEFLYEKRLNQAMLDCLEVEVRSRQEMAAQPPLAQSLERRRGVPFPDRVESGSLPDPRVRIGFLSARRAEWAVGRLERGPGLDGVEQGSS